MQSRKPLRKLFIITGKSSESRNPAKASLNDPSSGKEHKASFGLRELDHLEHDAMGRGSLPGILFRIALICKGNLHDLFLVPDSLLLRFAASFLPADWPNMFFRYTRVAAPKIAIAIKIKLSTFR
jgi:hypothetical protein